VVGDAKSGNERHVSQGKDKEHVFGRGQQVSTVQLQLNDLGVEPHLHQGLFLLHVVNGHHSLPFPPFAILNFLELLGLFESTQSLRSERNSAVLELVDGRILVEELTRYEGHDVGFELEFN
jgi:hypothetical protein